MIVQFEASSLKSESEDDNDPPFVYVFALGLTGDYLSLARAKPIGGPEDWGIHIEVNDQIYSGYDQIARCELTSTAMAIVLTKPLGRRAEIEGVNVRFTPKNPPNPHFIEHLRLIFTGKEQLLDVTLGT